jgi:Leucine-rich repeat (LRR) protein
VKFLNLLLTVLNIEATTSNAALLSCDYTEATSNAAAPVDLSLNDTLTDLTSFKKKSIDHLFIKKRPISGVCAEADIELTW